MTYVIKLLFATLVVNIVNQDKTIILICPGGGYGFLSNRESDPIAVKFNTLGYNTAVLYYSLPPYEAARPYNDGVEALKYLSKEFENIIVMGFSAGGHLAGLLGTKANSYNVKAMVLSYPVVSLGEYTHTQSATNFLNGELTKENIYNYSVQNCVNEKSVPCFLWCTKDDLLVPYENTLMLKEALDKYHIYNECSIYPTGPHGYALADITAVVKNGPYYYNEEIAQWPLHADKFIRKVLNKEDKQ